MKAVKAAVKGLPFDQWGEKLRTTFNNDSILRIRVEKGIFKQGDNALVDKEIFKEIKILSLKNLIQIQKVMIIISIKKII